MSGKRRTVARAALGLCLGLLSGVAAYAQEQGNTGLEEVVVTATKRAQNLGDVSIAVTAVTAERLQGAHIDNIEGLQAAVPNINFGNDFNTAKLFIRGVGTNTSVAGSDPGVALHVDGAVVSRPEAQLLSLFDLERIEVLRGPQGTLYGRNAVGGSVNLITAKPTEEFTGYARLTLGNYDALTMQGALSGPITEKISARIAVQSNDRSGYGRNPVTGHDVDDLSKRMGRLHLDVDFADNVNLLLTLEGYRQDDASNAIKYRADSFPGNPMLPALGAGGTAENPRDLASEFDPQNKVNAWSATATLDWDFAGPLAFTSITNYRDFRVRLVQDLDASAVVNSISTTNQNTTIQNRNTFSEQFSQELQLKLDSERVHGVLGLYLIQEEFGSGPNSIGLTPQTGMPQNLVALANSGFTAAQVFEVCGLTHLVDSNAIPPRFCGYSTHHADAYAAFTQFTFDVNDRLSFKLGGRYSEEERRVSNPGFLINAMNGMTTYLSTATPGVVRERDFSDFSPEGGVEWRPTDDMLVYYTYSEAFKSGTGEATITTGPIIGPENVQNHELGFKASFDNLSLNVLAFQYELQGLQISKTFNDPAVGFVTRFENAAETSAKGLEVEVLWQATDQFRLDTAVAWIKSEFDDFETSDPLDANNVLNPMGQTVLQLEGNATRNSPELAFNLHGQYDWAVDWFAAARGASAGPARLRLSGDVSHKGKQYYSEFSRAIEGAEAYTLLDMSLRYSSNSDSGDDGFYAEIWGKNLTDEFEAAGTFALATAREIGVTWLPPRTFGVSLGYSF
jgi:iron complex outermembrane recepter protein